MSVSIFPTLLGAGYRVRREIIDRTDVLETVSGREQRNGWDFCPLHRYRIKYDWLRTETAYREAQRLAVFYQRHRGRLDSFLFRDPENAAVVDHGFATSNGAATVFQLQRAVDGDVEDALGTWPTYTKPRTNLLLQSKALDSASWTRRASHAVGAASVLAPDGTATADLITATAGAGNQGVYQDAGSANGTFTFSIWLRAGTLAAAQIAVKDRATDTVRASASVTSTGAWQRFLVTGTTAGATTGLRVEVNGSGSGTLYAWQAQAEVGSSATAPIATTTALATETPPYWPAIGSFEPIWEPDWSTVSILKDGVAQTPVTTWTPGATGLVSFVAAPASGAALSWSGSYFRRCRFDNTTLDLERFLAQLWRGEVTIAEVKP